MILPSLELGRFKRLPIRASDVWQGGLLRPPIRARGVFWFSTRSAIRALLLTGEKAIRARAEAHRLGSLEEAAIEAAWLIDAWTETLGAIFWLNTVRRTPRKPADAARARKEEVASIE